MKTVKTIIFISFSLIFSAINAQEKLIGNKDVTTENKDLSAFTKIEVIDDVTVLLVYNDKQSVMVETDSNIQSAIITEINNGTLIIKTSAKIVRAKELIVHVNVNNALDEIYAYNKAKVKSNNSLRIDSITLNSYDDSGFNLKLSSKFVRINAKKTSNLELEILCDDSYITSEESSNLKGIIDTKNMVIHTLDKSTVNLSGNTSNFEIETLHNSAFKGKDFKSAIAVVNTSNNSSAYINATETVDLSIKNSGEVYLFSNPKITLVEFFDRAGLFKR
ncbi:MAG: GIN domain-containing protein [Lutibacter sp.]